VLRQAPLARPQHKTKARKEGAGVQVRAADGSCARAPVRTQEFSATFSRWLIVMRKVE
jgi:hypothetical protein